MKKFTTQQVAQQTAVSAHTLRYYEKLGLICDVARDSNGYRQFTEADIEWIAFLIQLKSTGMPLAQMQRFAELRRMGAGTAKERREMLETHRQSVEQQIAALNDCLGMIDYKIARHRRMETTE